MSKPALLAPGGDYLSAWAAILAGADEVYVGLGRFNARRRAVNLTVDDIRRLSSLARTRGASIFITTNVLITDDEIGEMLALIGECHAAGASGVIVQDPGLLYLLRSRLPELEVHVSTQMTVHSRAQIDYLAAFGVARINLARELTLEEITLLSAHAAGLGISTEVFVHGAYCISYSGQCFMSSFMGGQSGNRGVCFQPCRRFYTPDDAGGRILSLNLKDNNALPHVSELADAGVGALKIEGRMKGPWYVHTLVGAYRAALDGEDTEAGQTGVSTVFNRGFSAGYLEGSVTGEMFKDIPFDASLIPAGIVDNYHAAEQLLSFLPAGDGLESTPAPGDQGVIYTEENRFIALITVEEIFSEGRCRITIREVLKGRIESGMHLFIQRDTDRQAAWLAELEAEPEVPVPLRVEVSAAPGEPLRSSWKAAYSAADSPLAEVSSLIDAEPARAQALDEERLRAQFGKLGDTPFGLESLRFEMQQPVFLPLGELNRMRRRAVELLTRRQEIEQAEFIAALDQPPVFEQPEAAGMPRFLVFVTSDQLQELSVAVTLTAMPDEFLLAVDPLREALFTGRNLPQAARGFIFPAVIEDDQFAEIGALIVRTAAERPDMMVISANSGIAVLAAAAGLRWIAGSDLHTVNVWGAASFLGRGAAAAVVSRELSGSQIFQLIKSAGENRIYIPVFGPLLLMTTRQCLYRRSFGCARELSDRTCRETCARDGWIEDDQGNRFLIVKRPGGQTELYNQALLALPEAVQRFQTKAGGFVIDLRIGEISRRRVEPSLIMSLFSSLLTGGLRPDEVRTELKNLLGTEGVLTWGSYKRGLQ